MLKLNSLLLIIILLALSLSCSTNPPDKPVCTEITMTKAICTKMVSGEDFIVDETHKFEDKTWWEQRHLMLQMPISTWTSIKSFTIKMCKKYGCKDKDIASWDRAQKNVDKAIDTRLK